MMPKKGKGKRKESQEERLARKEKAAAVRAANREKHALKSAMYGRPTGGAGAPKPSAGAFSPIQARMKMVERLNLMSTLTLESLEQSYARLKKKDIVSPIARQVYDAAHQAVKLMTNYSGEFSGDTDSVKKTYGTRITNIMKSRGKRTLMAEQERLQSIVCLLESDAFAKEPHHDLLLQYVMIYLKEALFLYVRRRADDSLASNIAAFEDIMFQGFKQLDRLIMTRLNHPENRFAHYFHWFAVSEPFQYYTLVKMLMNPDDARDRTQALLCALADYVANAMGLYGESGRFTEVDREFCLMADSTGMMINQNSLVYLLKTGWLHSYTAGEAISHLSKRPVYTIEEAGRLFLLTNLYHFSAGAGILATDRADYGVMERIMYSTRDNTLPVWKDARLHTTLVYLLEKLNKADDKTGWLYWLVAEQLGIEIPVDVERKTYAGHLKAFVENAKAREAERDAVVAEVEEMVAENEAAAAEAMAKLRAAVLPDSPPPSEQPGQVTSESKEADTSDDEDAPVRVRVKVKQPDQTPKKMFLSVIRGDEFGILARSVAPTAEFVQTKLEYLKSFEAFHLSEMVKKCRYDFAIYTSYRTKFDAYFRELEGEAKACGSNRLVVKVNLLWVEFLRLCEQFIRRNYIGEPGNPFVPNDIAHELINLGEENIAAMEYLLQYRGSSDAAEDDDGFVVVGQRVRDGRASLEDEASRILDERERVKHSIPRQGLPKPFEQWSFKARRAWVARRSLPVLTAQRERIGALMARISTPAAPVAVMPFRAAASVGSSPDGEVLHS